MNQKYERKRDAGEKNLQEVLILLSGGIDSAACVSHYKTIGFSVSGLFIDYGQPSAKQESKAVSLINEYYKIKTKKITVKGLGKFTKGFITGRNALLFQLALTFFRAKAGLIASGIHSGTFYADCSPNFINLIQQNYDLYTGGIVQIDTPFLTWSKNEIWAFCKVNKVPINLTYSCELGKNQPCSECLSCKDLEVLNAS